MGKRLDASLWICDVRVHRLLMAAEAALFRIIAQTRYCLDAGAEAGMS